MERKYKYLFFITLIILIVFATIMGCVYLKKPKQVVREPEEPGESTLQYSPLPTPAVPLLDMAANKMLLSAITPKFTKIIEGVYFATGFGFSNMVFIITPEGVVVVDTTESVEGAKEASVELRKITKLPIKYIIYTHGHGDHTQGAKVFYEEGTKVIATKEFIEFVKFETEEIGGYTSLARRTQAGILEEKFGKIKIPIRSPVRDEVVKTDLVMPNITFEDEYKFEFGGKKFELYHAPGETPDTIFVWLPKERILICGDDYYSSFPNLSSPMLKARPIKGWIQSLDKAISLKPAYLLPGHTLAVIGEKEIQEVLTNYRDAVKYVYDKTIEGINQGKDINTLASEIKLPPELANLPYLREYYGKVSWSVRGIYQGTVGWYDGNGTNLNPLPSYYKAREIVKLSGGADKILARAIELQKAGEHQLVLELCDVVISANSKDKVAHLIKAVSLEYLATSSSNLNAFGFYKSASQVERKLAEGN